MSIAPALSICWTNHKKMCTSSRYLGDQDTFVFLFIESADFSMSNPNSGF